MYEGLFEELATTIGAVPVELVGLGCGGGQKDGMLASALLAAGASVSYCACDASPGLVLTASSTLERVVPDVLVTRLVADLVEAVDLDRFWKEGATEKRLRIFSCLGIVPNVSPAALADNIVSWMDPGDWLVMSANLYVADDPQHDLAAILSQYDNPLTRRWLSTLLDDVGLEGGPSALDFSIENDEDPSAPARVQALLRMKRDHALTLDGEAHRFAAGEAIRVFYSNRFTRSDFEAYLQSNGLTPAGAATLDSGEEGAWICVRK